jgi:nucleoside-diphosphate-sugar epimerase
MSLSLVTGAPGWLGTNLVHALVAGLAECPALGPTPRPTRCLVQPGLDASALEALGVEIVRGDVTDPASLRPFFAGARDATLFHAAGIVHVTKGIRQFYEVNVTGTANLLAAAKAARIRRFILVSSNSPIGCNAARDGLFDEEAPYHPYLNYGRSKMLAEMAVRGARDFEWVIVRPPWFYGPCQPPRQSLFFAMIRDGTVPIVGAGENRRSLAYVDNICQGLLLCDRIAGANGRIYWIADRHPYPMTEIIATIARILEEEFGIPVVHKARRLPAFASDIAFGVDAVAQGLGLYLQKIHVLGEMNKTIACTVAKAERELGYAPKIELREGMRRSIAWVLEHNLLPRP